MKIQKPKKKYRRLITILACILLPILFIPSCMRFRTSDKKTKQYFDEVRVATEIIYTKDTVSHKKIRTVKTHKNSVGKAVLFIHGAPGSGDAFYKYLKDSVLLANANLYTVDRPGYGYSDFGNVVISIEEQTRLINLLVDAIPESNVVVVGHSYGGPIAANMALISDKVKGVLMIAPAIDPEHEKIFAIAHLGTWKALRWLIPKAWLVATDEKFSHANELKKIQNKWENVNVPVVVMHGKKDKLVPFENTDFTNVYFSGPNYRLVVFEKENHFIPWTKREAVIQQLLKLLQNISNF